MPLPCSNSTSTKKSLSPGGADGARVRFLVPHPSPSPQQGRCCHLTEPQVGAEGTCLSTVWVLGLPGGSGRAGDCSPIPFLLCVHQTGAQSSSLSWSLQGPCLLRPAGELREGGRHRWRQQHLVTSGDFQPCPSLWTLVPGSTGVILEVSSIPFPTTPGGFGEMGGRGVAMMASAATCDCRINSDTSSVCGG